MRVFENVLGEQVKCIWDRVHFWVSLWASVASELKELSFSVLSFWKAAVFGNSGIVLLGLS